jgi:hypothetical protein
MGRTNTAIVLMSVMAMILMTAIPAATAIPSARSTGMRGDTIHVEFVGKGDVESLGHIPVIAQVFNNSNADLVGAYVNLTSDGVGSFDAANGVANATGVYATVFHAPSNPTNAKMTVNVTAHVNISGYANFSKAWAITVFPIPQGAPVPFDAAVKHLVYETTFGPTTKYLTGSLIRSGIDFTGNIMVNIDGANVQVANFTTWAMGDLYTYDAQYLVNHHIYFNSSGYYYYETALHGIVFSSIMDSTADYSYNATSNSWYNISEWSTLDYVPAMRTYNLTSPVFGNTQEILNTYRICEGEWHTGGGQGASSGWNLKTTVSEYTYLQYQDITTFMGTFSTEVFMDHSGKDLEYFSPELSILLKEVAFDQAGHQISTRSLTGYNGLKAPEPLPALAATVTSDSLSLVAGTSTPVHVLVTNGTAPVVGAPVKATVGQGGSLTPAQGITGSDGMLELTFVADIGAATANVDVSIVANKTGYQNVTATTTIMVLQDITPPFVSHRPFETAEAGVPLKIEALAGDDAGVAEVLLHYRTDVPGTYIEVQMTLTDGVYSATIPAEAMAPPLVEYWLSVSDINGNGVALPYVAPDDGQFDIHVLPTFHIVGPVSIPLANGGTASVTAGVRGDLNFNLTSVKNPDAGPADTRFMGQFADIRAIGSGTLVWANISFTYTTTILGKLNEQELQIYWWDTQGKTWMSTDHDGVIADQDMVWANVSHLTIFAPRAQTVPVITPPSDTTVPTASVVYPSNLATMTTGSFKLVGQASDDMGLFSVQVQVDNGAWVDVLVPTGAKSAGWVYDLNLKDGKHTVLVRAKDQAGNLGASTTITLTVKKQTTEKVNGVTMTNVIGAIMALIIVCLVVLCVFLIGRSSQTDKQPAKPEKTIEKDEEE